jgi:hypothetical protein
MKISRNTWLIAVSAVIAGTVATTAIVTGAGAETRNPAPAASPVEVKAAGVEAATGLGKPVDGRLGEIIPTGMSAEPGSDWVIYGVPVKNKFNPKTTFGFVMAVRDRTGKVEKLDADSGNYESNGGELALGFHVPEIPATLQDGAEQPAYGYFVGDPAKITGTVDGKTYVARTATWSADASVKVFWFDNTQVTGSMRMTGVTAYDTAGKQLAKARVYNYGE